MAQIVEAQQLEAAGNYVGAAEAYLKVEPSSPARPEAEYRAGNCYQKEVWEQAKAKKVDEAKAAGQKAEKVLTGARTTIAAAAGKTLDEQLRAKLSGLTFAVRMAMANLYLCDALGKVAEVEKVLEGAEKECAGDAQRTANVWELRFRALQSQGRLDDAKKLLDKQLEERKGSTDLAPAALALGQALDRSAAEMKKSDPKSPKPTADWRDAAKYYQIWLAACVRGAISADPAELERVGKRLYTIGLDVNVVPEGVDSFAEWTGSLKEAGQLRGAAQAFESASSATQSAVTLLLLARTRGFLGEWAAAAEAYGKLFQATPIVDTNTKRFDMMVIRDRPELVPAWVEWGVVERRAALADNDTSRLAAAFGVFETLKLSVAADSKLWWQGQYWLCRILADKGQYNDADFAVRQLERTSEGFDGGRFGMAPLFEALKAELKTKVVSK
jgi:tetratricopeptide (TPR) repeat protein